ncbi:MAG: ATP-binding cassette domain-containing protein [candidate division Zixibacteria bacterium]|nr:ATP-binding cassette domain-containing protein [candidate division Zixibacteria bacterium]
MIRIENLSKTYNSKGKAVLALREVSWSIEKGEFVSIVGPSGSGKTTLLLCIGGLIHPSSGKVTIEGTSIYDLDFKKRATFRLRNLGFVFQTFNLIPYLTAIENVQIPLSLAGTSDGTQSQRAAELLEKLGLADRVDHKPRELSIGEQQRVAVARALANNPKIILADEPTGNLDPDMTRETIGYLRLLSKAGITVVMVTHNPGAAECAERRLRLVGGRLVQ